MLDDKATVVVDTAVADAAAVEVKLANVKVTAGQDGGGQLQATCSQQRGALRRATGSWRGHPGRDGDTERSGVDAAGSIEPSSESARK